MNKSARIIQQLQEAAGRKRHRHGCLMADLPPMLAKALVTWASANIPDGDLYNDENLDKGRETRPHVTVKFGFTSTTVLPALRAIVSRTKPIAAKLGEVSLFTGDDYDVVVVLVHSPGLKRLNHEVSQLPNEDKFPVYSPHCTVAYVKPGRGEDYVGKRLFDLGNDGFIIDKLTFTGEAEHELKLAQKAS